MNFFSRKKESKDHLVLIVLNFYLFSSNRMKKTFSISSKSSISICFVKLSTRWKLILISETRWISLILKIYFQTGNTLLLHCSEDDKLVFLQYLLIKGCDINLADLVLILRYSSNTIERNDSYFQGCILGRNRSRQNIVEEKEPGSRPCKPSGRTFSNILKL